MESTLLHSFLKAGHLKHWLAELDCPAVIKECKTLFDKIYSPKVLEGEGADGDTNTDHVNVIAKNIPSDYNHC